jgi:hypothetical protein
MRHHLIPFYVVEHTILYFVHQLFAEVRVVGPATTRMPLTPATTAAIIQLYQ